MTPFVHTILGTFAVCCFALAAWQSSSPVWNRLVSIGLASLAMVLVF